MLKAHSLAEAQLYLKITVCETCNSNSVATPGRNERIGAPDGANVVHLTGQCAACGAPVQLDFAIETKNAPPLHGRPPTINATEVHSRIIDVGQWLTLSQLFVQESKSEKDKGRARLLNLQAAQCLDEALKFYDDPENDLPPTDALYSESSRRRFHESPQQFSRSRLISERRKLPVIFGEV